MDTSHAKTPIYTKGTMSGEKSEVDKTERQKGQSTTYDIPNGLASLNVHDGDHEPETVHELIRGNTKYIFKKKGLFTRVIKEEIHLGTTSNEKQHDETIQKGKPVGEGKKAWPCACGNPEHDAVARIVEVQYKSPVYATERTLRIPASAHLPIGELKFGVEHVMFEKGFVVKDSHLRQIARGTPAFRASLRALTCGDSTLELKLQTEVADTFTDRQITEIARSCPNLEVVHFATPGLKLVHTSNFDGLNMPTPAFQKLVQCCYKLQSLTLSATRSAPGTLDPEILSELKDRSVCKALRYLELQNLEVEDEFALAVLLKSITKRRRELEIAHGWMGVVYLYRGGESYLLERDLDGS
ncbi:hypothetical protein BDV96DRAFT_661862 [Lophiotrema nucula]|uniref:Uncharacterized protein n=1 Tax=Lophiotrema nucula TaxID=690887 RepID=A0A6A5Z415_9PLEO|nr:hypothetical protein BDV96DRAFT_661862 [Lophiotrema nucula]